MSDAPRSDDEHADRVHTDAATAWWRNAVIYQVYVRSFADGNGDGTGDLAGVRSKLPYLAELGVDALWFNPWYASPLADAGYDVADYRAIDPRFGTLAEAEQLIGEAHQLGLRVILDIVPNHSSDQHEWFLEALAAGPGAEARELFWFRPGRGEHGQLPPNNWKSVFGGDAWTRTVNPDGSPGEWYLHLFASEQPDLNWENPKVREDFEDVLRFWFDRGVDGIRIDSATMPAKDAELPDFDEADPPFPHPFVDRDEVHDIYRAWRALADGYTEPRALIGEVWLDQPERLAAYLRPDEMHTAFNFDYLNCAWDADELRRVITETLAAHAPVDAPATWVLSNHDVTRHVSRYGRADTSFGNSDRQYHVATDLELGTRRARAATLLSLALPGSAYLYQGEELGLWEVDDIPDALRDDPYFHRTNGEVLGRDGCRVPLPWSGDRAPFGFSPAGASAAPWLPQPAEWAALTAAAEQGVAGSMLELYRTALRIRREQHALGDGSLEWLDSPAGTLVFRRGEDLVCAVNLTGQPVGLAVPGELLLSSGGDGLDGADWGGELAANTAVWLRTTG
ncbi:glycoside hydrolase family 13 protein [Streptacidiphilus sp. PAMC 29251]